MIESKSNQVLENEPPGATVIALRPRREREDDRRIKDALDSIARLLGHLVRFAEKRGRDDVARDAARICGEIKAMALQVTR